MMSAQDKAEVLIEALPWLEKFQDEVVVIKFGGHAMVDVDLMRAFADDVAFLRIAGIKPVVVHGGGPQISAELTKRGIESSFIGGLRVTTPEVMSVVRDVLVGQVQRDLVKLINEHGSISRGVAGDNGLLTATRVGATVDGKIQDIGLVGEVTTVAAEILTDILNVGLVPVVSTVALDAQGVLHNVNADTAAAAIAVALDAAKLVVLTDVPGLYRNWPNTSDLISRITVNELRDMLPTLESGMVPKMQACLEAVEAGLDQATVVDGRSPHCVLLEVFTENGVGTMVVAQ